MREQAASVIFVGTPDFATPSLKALHAAGFPILLVVTQPDRPKGRGRKLVAPPVKRSAQARGLPVFQPERIKNPDAIERLVRLEADFIVVVAYGQLLSGELLGVPALGAVNVHASLLPKYRGPAPIHWALLQGEAETGVTTMFMDEGMDTGDILLQRKAVIRQDETAGTLHDRLAQEGATLLVETLNRLTDGTLTPIAQDHSLHTYAPTLAREDGRVDWQQTASRICCRIRGLDPWPGAFTVWRGKRLKLFGCRTLPFSGRARPGTVVAAGDEGLQVAADEGAVLIRSLQLEGRRLLPVADFLKGNPLEVEALLGE